MRIYTYPHNDNQVRDIEAPRRVSRLQECLHQPIFFIQSVTGLPNEPLFCSGAEAIDEYGAATFDRANPIYGNEQFYLENAIFPYHASLIVRLVDENAKQSNLVVELHVTESLVVQYERDSNGAVVVDGNNDPIPLLDSSNQIIREPGYRFKYVARQLAVDEEYDRIRPKTVSVAGVDTTIYPIVACLSRSPGSYTNSVGLKIYFDYYAQDSAVVADKKALTFVIEPCEITYGTSITSPVRNRFGIAGTAFTAKPLVYDERTRMYISFNEKMKNNYYRTQEDGTEIPILPYDIKLYTETFETVGTLIKTAETNDNRIETPWLADIISARNIDGYQYSHVDIDYSIDSAHMNNTYVNYLNGGTDGDTSRAAHEERICNWLTGNVYPFITDDLRYPLTHIYDVGYSYKTKEALIKFMALRSDVRPIMSSQDISMKANSREEDYSIAHALRAKALLIPESMVYGTPCCRAEIYCCVGRSTDNQYLTPLPLTFWACCRRAESMGSTKMKFTLGGQPISVIDMIKNLNYLEYDKDIKQDKFNNGINYPQYANRITIFLPDVRSVYIKTTSLLGGASYVDAVTIAKGVANKAWSLYSGSDRYPEEMYGRLGDTISAGCRTAFGDHYNSGVTVYQTEEQRIEGDHLTAELDIIGNLAFRKLSTIINPRRYNTTGVSYSTTNNAFMGE